MASIDKLSVRGIRSFSPDEEEQVIKFGFPLTIIVGKNGCGKTTIIEALKYATTGSMPLGGTKGGQSFVHDPKHMGSTTVKAQVKLRFSNKAQKQMVVVRSMELKQQKKNMKFSNLDGTIRTQDEDGNRQTLSHKCTELDRMVPNFLGISKAVLENVVFCHQEDSSWPLQEGAVLKKKFDDIFDSSRYVKALEEIKNQKKEYNNQSKDLKAELNLLKGHKHAANGFRMELDEVREKLSLIEDERRELEEKIDSYQKDLNAIAEEQFKYETLMEEKDNISAQMSNEVVRLETQKKSLLKDHTESKTREDLEDILRGYEKQMKNASRQYAQINQRLEECQRDIDLRNEERMSILGDKGKLENEKASYDTNLQKRIEMMEELATKFGLELTFSQSQETEMMNTQGSAASVFTGGFSGGTNTTIQITDDDLEAFVRSVRMKKDDLDGQLSEQKSRKKRVEDRIQEELGELNGKLKSIENDISRTTSERDKAKKEFQKISRISTTGRMRESEINDAKAQARKLADARDEIANNPRLGQIPKEIEKHEKKVDELKFDINGLNEDLKELRKVAEQQNQIAMLESQVTADIEAVSMIINESSSLFQARNIDIPDAENENLKNNLLEIMYDTDDKFTTSTNDLERYARKLKDVEARFSKLSAVVEQNKASLNDKSNQLRSLSAEDKGVAKIKRTIKMLRQYELTYFEGSDVPAAADPQEVLQHISQKVGELNQSFDKPETIIRTIKKLKKLSKKKDPDSGEAIGIICPCCNRDVDDFTEFQAQLSKLMDLDESPLIKADRESANFNSSAITNYNNWRNTISSGLNDYLDHKRLSTEIQDLRDSIKSDEAELKTLETELTEAKEKVEEEKEEKSNIQEFLDVIKPLRDEAMKIDSKRSKIMNMKADLDLSAPSVGGKNLATAENELTAKSEEKDKLQSDISALNKELAELNDHITSINSRCSQAENIVRNKEKQFAEEQKATIRKNELNEQLKKLQAHEAKLKEEIAPISSKVSIKNAERDKQRKESDREIEKSMNLINNFNNEYEKFRSLCRDIKTFADSNKLRDLQGIDGKLSEILQSIKDLEEEKREMAPEIEELKASMKDEEAQRDNIRRNIEIFEIKDNLRSLEDQETILQDKMEALNFDEIADRASMLKRKIEESRSERDKRLGSKDSLAIQNRELKRKLKTKEYDDIDERHRICMINHETAAMCVSDLDLYYAALDQALLRYHNIKIETINKTIKELWALTYRGEDITNIRLTSDMEKGAKKSYNYRVVMSKGTTELDMRGRCSAGQRVLASLVIRLALAETFCIDCGVMALDEPTTNLDYANKKGLALGLAQIISQRCNQENFQLVVITHDEEFVTFLKDELATHTGFAMPEQYYQVKREQSHDGCYYSKINAIDFDEI